MNNDAPLLNMLYLVSRAHEGQATSLAMMKILAFRTKWKKKLCFFGKYSILRSAMPLTSHIYINNDFSNL